MAPEERARRADEETVRLCAATAWRGPRDYLVDCRTCGRPFWAHGGARGGEAQLSCSAACRVAWCYRHTPGVRERALARRRARRAA